MSDPIAELSLVAESVERRFREGRRVLSFAEYLELLAREPHGYARDASRYVRDCFDYFGTKPVRHPWGEFTRWRLFDLEWEPEGQRKGALVGQESVQEEIYRALSNFVREGRPTRLVLLHGPNGSAKSTIVGCVLRALERYSQVDEGALYRFNWVFPTTRTTRGSLGFAQRGASSPVDSYAHLTDGEIDAKVLVEVRDHPLFLIPIAERRALLERLAPPSEASEPWPDWILRGELSHKSQQIFEALLASYGGSYQEILKHVQVERYFVSQRYRVGAVTLGPQMSVDAGERQVTMDRSLAALPASLQAITLYEALGELIDAAGGVIEFSDLLKRPLDAFKYLQLSVETGEIQLSQQNVQLNCVMMGSANELHLDAFREHPEFASFRGRLELIQMPYMRSYLHEQSIYDTHVAPQVRRHVAPHATMVAAMFAVLTRMRKPSAERLDRDLAAAVSGLSAMEKVILYATGRAPERLEADAQKVLRSNVRQLFEESQSEPVYEGRIGASPREMRGVLLDAAQSTRYRCLFPLAVLDELEQLCERRSEFEWLQLDVLSGGYHDVRLFRDQIMQHLLERWEQELYGASGFVEEARYRELFERYVVHVSVWTKNEKIRNKLTGDYEEPDEAMMQEVERLLDVKVDAAEARRQTISTIAAWAIDHPDEPLEALRVFPSAVQKLRDAIFADKRPAVAAVTRDMETLVRDEGRGLDGARRRAAQRVLDALIGEHGYCSDCAGDMAGWVIRRRFAELGA